MTAATLEAANDALRAAVEERLAGCQPAKEAAVRVLEAACCDGQRTRVINSDGQECQRLRGDSLLSETYSEWVPPRSSQYKNSREAQGGTTEKFGTGAVRSDTFEEFRYDLVSPIGLREVARACAEGAGKYGDWNWERGMPVHDLLNHAIAHIYGFLSGDRSEPHLGHAAWNLLAAIHSHELWPHLNAGTLRNSECGPPT